MKILHYSDQSAQNFNELYAQCDILVATGDLTYFDFGTLLDHPHQKPAFGVYGNHDSGQYFEKLGITNLHNQIVEYAGLKWGGYQGCLKYKPSPLMYTEEEASIWAKSFPPVDILLLHAGPQGMLDDPTDAVHTGSPSIRQYVLQTQPKLVFVGHQYSNDQLTLNNTQLYRIYGARIIEV